MKSLKLTWVDPIRLSLADDDTEKMLVKRLRAEIKGEVSDRDLKQSVYLVRMVGRAVIDYDRRPSPVVYIGRGDSVGRLASHLKNWASKAFTWGHDTSLEIRIIRPEHPEDADCFKHLEADLIRWFADKCGMLPLMNARFETSFERKAKYLPSDRKRLHKLLTVGSGKRPHWAIFPLRANPHYDRYYKST
jgi:hypothetical protein